jgi:hypothetical protein
MILHRALSQAPPIGDLFVGRRTRQQREQLTLARGERQHQRLRPGTAESTSFVNAATTRPVTVLLQERLDTEEALPGVARSGHKPGRTEDETDGGFNEPWNDSMRSLPKFPTMIGRDTRDGHDRFSLSSNVSRGGSPCFATIGVWTLKPRVLPANL